jgi:hypothetical protein
MDGVHHRQPGIDPAANDLLFLFIRPPARTYVLTGQVDDPQRAGGQFEPAVGGSAVPRRRSDPISEQRRNSLGISGQDGDFIAGFSQIQGQWPADESGGSADDDKSTAHDWPVLVYPKDEVIMAWWPRALQGTSLLFRYFY